MIKNKKILPDVFETDKKNDGVEYVKMKSRNNVSFMGQVDSGKSTMAGQLLYKCGSVGQHTIDAYTEKAKLVQKNTFQFAWCMDKTQEERNKGVTIDVSHSEYVTSGFESDGQQSYKYWTLVDCPGHRDFKNNAIGGITQSDLAVLCVDVQKSLHSGETAQDHLLIARANGINSVIVALSKVDLIQNVTTRMETIKERTEEAENLVASLGYPKHRVHIIPVNSYGDWNLTTKDHNEKELPGYTGKTIIEAMHDIEIDALLVDYPFRMSIEGVHGNVAGTSKVYTGKVLSGSIQNKDKVVIKGGVNSNITGTVRGVQMHHKNMKKAECGDNIGLDIASTDSSSVKRGSVISHADKPAKLVSQFVCEKAVIYNHPTKVTKGANLIGHSQSGHVPLEIKKIEKVYDLKNYRGKFNEDTLTDNEVQDIPGYTRKEVDFITSGCIAKITFIPKKPIIVETVTEHPKLCNVLLRDLGITVGWAKVTETKLHDLERKN